MEVDLTQNSVEYTKRIKVTAFNSLRTTSSKNN